MFAGLALLQAAQVQLPEEVEIVRLPARGISCIQSAELAHLCNLRCDSYTSLFHRHVSLASGSYCISSIYLHSLTTGLRTQAACAQLQQKLQIISSACVVQ